MNPEDKDSAAAQERPCFLIDNRVYVSAGVLPYTVDSKDTYYFLFQRLTNDTRKWTYEDFGGKSMAGDTSISAVAFRECHEETNYRDTFTPAFLESQLQDKRSVIYRISESKYLLYLIYVPPELKDTMNLEQFGTSNNDEQQRVLEWISYKSLMEIDDKDMHPRFIPSDFKCNLPLILAHPTTHSRTQYF